MHSFRTQADACSSGERGWNGIEIIIMWTWTLKASGGLTVTAGFSREEEERGSGGGGGGREGTFEVVASLRGGKGGDGGGGAPKDLRGFDGRVGSGSC